MNEKKPLKKDWVLTAEAFAVLLSALDPENEESAALKYERLRQKLIRKFTFERIFDAESLTDEVFNRVARRLSEGERIDSGNPDGYFLQTARLVTSENRRREKAHRQSALEDLNAGDEPFSDPLAEKIESEERKLRENAFGIIEKCRREMSAEDRRVYDIYEYGEGRVRIERRQRLAEEMKERVENLRLIVCRIKKKLVRCAEKEIKRSGLDFNQ